ncbi:MAG TPA: hypothetical protein VGK48_11510 [Terriglobia bacterium]
MPAQTRSFKDLLQDLQARSQAVKTLKAAKVLFQPSSGARKKGELTETRVPVAGFILVDRPNDIRIRLNLPLLGTTGADLISDGHFFKVWVPFTNKLYEGNADEAIQIGSADLQLPPPKEISNALFVDIRPYLDNPKYVLFPKETTKGTRSYYVVSIVSVGSTDESVEIVQEIWIDRTDMEIAQQSIYGKGGQLLTEAEFAGYSMRGDSPFPKAVTIHRPIEDVNLKITFQTPPELNTPLADNAFQLASTGAEVVHMSGQKPGQ